MEVQIFGVKKSADTRKALRFFAERRIKTHFVDFDERTVALGELKRFVQKYGLDALLDRDGKAYAEAGLRYAPSWTPARTRTATGRKKATAAGRGSSGRSGRSPAS